MKPREAAASLEQLKKDLKEGDFKRFYLLFGPERYLRNFYEKKLIAALGGERGDINTNIFDTSPLAPGAVIDAALTLPFFAERRIVVVRYSGFFETNPDDLVSFLAKSPETTTFIFVEDVADARFKLYKQINKLGRCVEFVAQPDKYLLQNMGAYLKKAGKMIGTDDAKYLLDVIGTDMGKLMSELEKLEGYTGDRELITREDIDAICSKNIEDRIFQMVDAVMRKDIRTCMNCYEDLLALKVSPGAIIIMIEKQFLWMLQLKSMKEDGYHENDIIDFASHNREVDPETGEVKKTRGSIGEFQVRLYLRQAEGMSLAALQKSVNICARADEDFKTGRINDRLAAETLMATLCNEK